jgi:hypothetical protein
MFPRKPISDLINDSMFLPLDKFNSPEVKKTIADPKQHEKTVREMLTNLLNDKIKRTK